MNLRRVLVFSLAAVLLLTGLWLVGGNAWAARREEKCDREWTAAFGSLEDLKKKYPKHETNGTAKRLEELTRESVFDLTPVVRSREPGRRHLDAEWQKSQGMFDFLTAQIARTEAAIDPPSEDVTRFLEEKRVALDAIESILAAGPPPRWSFDPSLVDNEDRMMSNGLGQIRLQRALVARALAGAHAGRHDAAARSLEASWNLNESLRGRPEIFSALLGNGIARLQVGALRKVNVEEASWKARLLSLDFRPAILDAGVRSHWLLSEKVARSRRTGSDREAGSWLQPAREFLGRPFHRLTEVDYEEALLAELVRIKGSALSDDSSWKPAGGRGVLPEGLLGIVMPNIKNSLVRADRLVVEAELTSKILDAKRLRKENGGRWPAAIPGIEVSRYPEASWRYDVSPEGHMSLAFSRELASPYGKDSSLKLLPLRFSSN